MSLLASTLPKCGFTGTSQDPGITIGQRIYLEEHLPRKGEFHFGDCINADKQAFFIAKARGLWTVSHPPINEKKRAFCSADLILPAKEYIDRNHDIVDSVYEMFAAPHTSREKTHSGTWATIRYARKRGVKVTIINPNGSIVVWE